MVRLVGRWYFGRAQEKSLLPRISLWTTCGGDYRSNESGKRCRIGKNYWLARWRWSTRKQTPPLKKKKLDHCNDAIIPEKVSSIESKLVFLNDLEQGFHCIIGKGVANSPIVSACCQRVVGCKQRANSWYCSSTRCPLCSTEDAIRNKFVLKGLGEMLKLLNITQREQGEPQDVRFLVCQPRKKRLRRTTKLPEAI